MRPVLSFMTLAFSPASVSVSMASVPESSGITRTATSIDSSETKTLSLFGSDSVVLPSTSRNTGKSVSVGVPTICRVRCFSSFM